MSIGDVVARLRCPHCGGGFESDATTLRCPAGHAFDIARDGHVSLLAGGHRRPRSDTAAMVAARVSFLGAGHYDALLDAVADAVAEPPPGARPVGCVLDVGSGPGHYLARVLDRVPAAVGIALDLSPHAARRAARAHPRVAAVVGDAWRPLPVLDEAADVVTVVFAPRDGPEIRRVLGPGGLLVVVTPTSEHLADHGAALGLLRVDERKDERLAQSLGPGLRPLDARPVRATMELDRAALLDLAAMGPSAWHVGPEEAASRVAALPPVTEVTASVLVRRYLRD